MQDKVPSLPTSGVVWLGLFPVKTEGNTLAARLEADKCGAAAQCFGKRSTMAASLLGMIAGHVFHKGHEPVVTGSYWLNLVLLPLLRAFILRLFLIWRRVIWRSNSSVFWMMLVFFISFLLGGFSRSRSVA